MITSKGFKKEVLKRMHDSAIVLGGLAGAAVVIYMMLSGCGLVSRAPTLVTKIASAIIAGVITLVVSVGVFIVVVYLLRQQVQMICPLLFRRR